ncbi:MAG: phage holin [Clostridium sp.]
MNTSRFKNYGLWVAVASLVPLVLKAVGVSVIPDDYNEIVTTILSILVMAGIINNPTTENKGFLDDPKELEKKE